MSVSHGTVRRLTLAGLSLQFPFFRHLQAREPASDPGPHGVQAAGVCLFNDLELIIHFVIFAAYGFVDEAVDVVGLPIRPRDLVLRLTKFALNHAISIIGLSILALRLVGLTLRLVKVNIGLGILTVGIQGLTVRLANLILRRVLRACCIDLLLQINRGKNHFFMLDWQLVCGDLYEGI